MKAIRALLAEPQTLPAHYASMYAIGKAICKQIDA